MRSAEYGFVVCLIHLPSSRSHMKAFWSVHSPPVHSPLFDVSRISAQSPPWSWYLQVRIALYQDHILRQNFIIFYQSILSPFLPSLAEIVTKVSVCRPTSQDKKGRRAPTPKTIPIWKFWSRKMVLI